MINMYSENMLDDFFVCSSIEDYSSNFDDIKQYFDLLDHLPEKYKKTPEFNPASIYDVLLSSSEFFRKSDKEINSLAIFWLSIVRDKALTFSSENSVPTLSLNKDDMIDLPHMSENEKSVYDIKQYLYDRGVVLVYSNNIPGMKVDGVSFLLDCSVPVIGMSLRYDRLDYFWFTLMHELSHIILHYDLLKKPFINDLDGDLTEIEQEANGLAMKSLIPRYKWRSFLNHFNPTKDDILRFAKELGIHPAIVAGKYMRDINNYAIFQEVVNCFSVRDALL